MLFLCWIPVQTVLHIHDQIKNWWIYKCCWSILWSFLNCMVIGYRDKVTRKLSSCIIIFRRLFLLFLVLKVRNLVILSSNKPTYLCFRHPFNNILECVLFVNKPLKLFSKRVNIPRNPGAIYLSNHTGPPSSEESFRLPQQYKQFN